jgi:hypothetical protein
MKQKQETIQGYEICPAWLKFKYRQAVDFNCQMCHKYEDKVGCLQPHRIKRKNEGGLYTVYPLNHKLNNIKVICDSCHKKIHKGEYVNKNLT